MKRLLEVAEQTPEPKPVVKAKPQGGLLARSLRRIGGLLFGWSADQ